MGCLSLIVANFFCGYNLVFVWASILNLTSTNDTTLKALIVFRLALREFADSALLSFWQKLALIMGTVLLTGD